MSNRVASYALLRLLATVLEVYRDPGIQRFFFSPGRMTCGDLNIAVAEFGVEDTQDRIVKSPNALALAESVSGFLTKEVGPCTERAAPSALGFKIPVWPPAKTGHIRGTTPED
jgi:hypothetical protein